LFLTSTSLTTQAVRLALLLPTSFAGAAHGQSVLPTGGTIASGTAAISALPGSVIINQSSNRAVINWEGFSVGQGNSVTFNQPGTQSATLNRVTGTTTSTIAGQITSVGAVYLINPLRSPPRATCAPAVGSSPRHSTLPMQILTRAN
jgi:large exoprotein involved in heme utilization and adhesion